MRCCTRLRATLNQTMAVKAIHIIAVLLVSSLLTFSPIAFAQKLDEATDLNQEVVQLYKQGRYLEALPLAERALAIRERALGPNNPDVATSLNNIASLYRNLGRYSDAEPLFIRSLAIRQKVLGPNHVDVAATLNNLAELYRLQARDTAAERLFKRSLAIFEQTLGADHPNVGTILSNLAALDQVHGRYAEAESLYKRSLAIREKVLGPDHPDVAPTLNNLALLYKQQARYSDAETLYKRAIAIQEKAFGANYPDVAQALNNLASLYRDQGRDADAEPLYTRLLETWEKALGPENIVVARSLNELALVYHDEGRYADAELLYKRSLAIREEVLGPDHPDVATSLNGLGAVYQAQGRYADADSLFNRSLAISERALGPDHIDVARLLNNIALLYYDQGRYADAEPLYKRSLAIWENARGPDHRDVAQSLNNLAALYVQQERYAEAEPLYKRSLTIWENALGSKHPAVAISLNNLAALYAKEGRYADALLFVQRVISQSHAQGAVSFSERYGLQKPIAFGVLYGAERRNLVAQNQALDASFAVFQRSASSAAGAAISQLAGRFAAGSSELAQLVRRDQDLAAEADRLDKLIILAISKPPIERNATTEEQIRKRAADIKLGRDKLQELLVQRFPNYVQLSKPQPLSVNEAQALLGNDEALVTIDLDEVSYVWVITKDQAQWKKLSISGNDVARQVANLRGGLDPNSLRAFDTRLAYHLYKQVLGPIEEVISAKSRLSFVLSGALTSLPPQVLITGYPLGKSLASVDWLVRKYAITVLPSVASLKVLRDRKPLAAAVKPMIGYGDPTFDRTTETASKLQSANFNRSLTSFYRGAVADMASLAKALPALPETADELRAVAKVLGAKSEDIRLRDAASVSNVKHAPLDNYRVVYFATHALVAGEVEKFAKVKAEPALVLSIPQTPSDDDDGLLRASDVATLKMNADFVVLSACNTAAGDKPGAEALSGLARAFFYAGAKSLVVSHWEVDSESTVALMTGLFDTLKSNPHLSHSEALRLSILRMIEDPSKPDWAQPKFWAPFVVVGEPQKQ